MAHADASDAPRHGPFHGLRGWLSWLFWGGFVIAAAAGAFASGDLPPATGAAKLALAFGVTIGWWVAAAWTLAWLVDMVAVFAKS